MGVRIKALLFGVKIKAPDFWKLPFGPYEKVELFIPWCFTPDRLDLYAASCFPRIPTGSL